MQETLLRRDRDERARAGEQDRLAQLQIPRPEVHALTLEARHLELVGEDVGAHGGGIVVAGAHDRLADDAHGKPRGVVALGHDAAGLLLEAVLHLRAGVLLEGAVPGDRHQPLRPGDGARLGGAEQHVVAEDVGLVGDDDDVVLRHALRQHGHLRLDLLMAGVGAARAGLERIWRLADDLAAEAGGGAPDRCGIALVGGRLAHDQEPAAPFLPDEILRERVGAHGPVGADVEHVGPALLLAQGVVVGADVENDGALRLGQIGDGEKIRRLEVGNDERVACRQQLLGLGRDVAVLRHHRLEQLVVLADQAPGAIVLLQRNARALHAGVGDDLVDQRERRRLVVVLAEIDDGRDEVRLVGRLGSLRPRLTGGERAWQCRRAPRARTAASARRRRLHQVRLSTLITDDLGQDIVSYVITFHSDIGAEASIGQVTGSRARAWPGPSRRMRARRARPVSAHQCRRSGPPPNTVRIQAMILNTS